jgi:hypothetical protein
MKKLIVFTLLLSFAIAANAQKTNLDKLPEKERNEYLLKTAYDAVMKHAPEWYRDYKQPEIELFLIDVGPDKGRKEYSVTWVYNPQEETMEWDFSVSVTIWADTGGLRAMIFGDGAIYSFESKTRNADEKPYYRPCPYKKNDL